MNLPRNIEKFIIRGTPKLEKPCSKLLKMARERHSISLILSLLTKESLSGVIIYLESNSFMLSKLTQTKKFLNNAWKMTQVLTLPVDQKSTRWWPPEANQMPASMLLPSRRWTTCSLPKSLGSKWWHSIVLRSFIKLNNIFLKLTVSWESLPKRQLPCTTWVRSLELSWRRYQSSSKLLKN